MSAQKKPLLLLLATVHLDSQWRWTIRDTIREFLPRTLTENFRLFRDRPSYVLNFEGAFRYMLAREYYPESWAELRRWCEAGRWIPAGGMLDAPDVNIASPECLIRHILYGNGFFERELGVRSRDVFLPDCFGFSHALPSVAAHCGLESFSTSKLIKWKAPGKIPFDIGRWRGPDGAEILAVLRPGGYGEGVDEDLSASDEWRERLESTRSRCGEAVGVRYFGTGDRGGSPDAATLDRVEQSVGADGPIEVRCAPSHAILDALGPQARRRLPVHDSEILLPTHGTGCWTSQTALKRWNRRNEQLAAAAERASVTADWLGVVDYPRARLDEGWLRLLWHQMHDDLTGTSIPAAYEITWNDEAVAANLFAGALRDAVGGVATRLDTRPPEALPEALPLVVFNPSGVAREDVVEMVVERGVLPSGGSPVVWRRGVALPTQLESVDADRVRLLFAASVAPLSFTVYHVGAGETPVNGGELSVGTDHLENELYRVGLDADGAVASVRDKRRDRELLAAPLRLELLRDRSDRWPAWEIRPETVLEPDLERAGGPARVRVVECGPVRVAVEVVRTVRGSTLVQVVRLAAGACGDRLELAHRLDWRTRGRLLKAAFPLSASNPLATYDLGLGVIERDNNTRDRYEVPAQQWAAIADRSGGHGAAILNDCLHGWDKPADNVLRLSLVRSPSSLRKYPHQRTQDLGSHESLVALIGTEGEPDRASICRQAERLNQPLLAFAPAPSPGDLGDELALFDEIRGDVSIMALKKRERGPGYVLRLRSLIDRDQTVRLVPRAEVQRPARLRGDERVLSELGSSLELSVGPSGVETVGFELAGPPAVASPTPSPLPDITPGDDPPRHRTIELPFDRRATTLHRDQPVADFDGTGASMPGELFPERLRFAGVELALGPPDRANALACRGQTIALPAGCDGLWIVAAAVGGRADVELELDTGRRRISIAPWTGLLAARRGRSRWIGLKPGRDGHLWTDELAWLGTHRHRSTGPRSVENEPYVFCYLFRYHLDLPPGTSRLTLPAAGAVHLFAMTATWGLSGPAKPLQPLYGV